MTKHELLAKIINEATTTTTKGTDESGDQGAYNTSVFGEIVRRENLYHYVDEYLGYGVKDKGGTDGPEMSKYNRVYRFNQGEQIQENKNNEVDDLYYFAVNSDYIIDDLINFLNEGIASNKPSEEILKDFKNYVDHLIFLYNNETNNLELSDDQKEKLAQRLFDTTKTEVGMSEATSVGGALGGVDQGMYSQPAIFAKDKNNWRNKDATYEGGEVVQRKNITNVVSNLNEELNQMGMKPLLEYLMNKKHLQKEIKNFLDERLKTDKDSETIFNEVKKYLANIFNESFKKLNLEKQHRFTELVIGLVRGEEETGALHEFTNAEGGNRYKVWDGAETVKIKRKCQDFPYCSEGAADNPIETEKMEEHQKFCKNCQDVVNEIAKETNKNLNTVAKIIKENYKSCQ